jgi:hypothetical protein
MFHRWAALVLVLALCAMSPKYAAGQTTTPRGHGAGSFGRSYPNPFNPDTYIQFAVGDTVTCAGVGEQPHVVSIRILNILAQPVAVPQLWSASPKAAASNVAANHPPIVNLSLPCGGYLAYWNGHIAATGREAASGTYLVQLFIDNALFDTKKIFYSK